MLDLAHRPDQDGLGDEVADAIRALAARCDVDELSEIASSQRLERALDRVRAAGLVS